MCLHIFACVRHFVHWNWCIKAMCSTDVLQFYGVVPFSLCRSRWNGCAKACRRVLVLQSCLAILIASCKSFWQIAFELLHRGCDLNVRICTKKNAFFPVNRSSVAKKSWLACATIPGVGVATLPWNLARFARA